MAVANRTRVAIAVAWFLALGFGARPLDAQSLQRLTVENFTLTCDTVRPEIDTPFHLIVTLRVHEPAGEITNLELPMLAQLELLGDERQTVSGPNGTQYRETVTVVAHSAGTIAISPATLQAIDARDGHAKQWYTNGLTLHIAPSAAQAIRNGTAVIARAALIVVGILLFGVLAVVVIVALRTNRARPAPVSPVAAQPAPTPSPRTARQRIEDALLVLSAERTRSASVQVRSAIWRSFGATDGETLGDLLRRSSTADPAVRSLLIALERSAFTYDEDLPRAIDDACAALAHYAETLA